MIAYAYSKINPVNHPPIIDITVVGRIIAHAGPIRDSDYLPCSGQILSIKKYPELFSIIGNVYGGDGINNFKLPELHGNSAMGADDNNPIGTYLGEDLQSLSEVNLPVHTHEVYNTGGGAGDYLEITNGRMLATRVNESDLYSSGSVADVNFNELSISQTGGSQPHENRQPFLGLMFSIKVR